MGTWTYQVLHALQDFPTSQQCLNAIRSREAIIIKQFEITLRERIIGSWRELDNLTPYETHHSSRTMRTYHHTHFGEPLGIAPGWWMTEKEITSLCYLSTFAWIFPTFSAVHFLAFFLAITFWSKECVITGIEGLMSSGSVTNVAGTLFRMRNTVCWTVRINILLISIRTQHRQLVFPPQYEDSPTRLRTF